MNVRSGLSARTRTNWLINASVFIGGILAGLSGFYFLFLPSGGYQGGRNVLYGIQILLGHLKLTTIKMSERIISLTE